ncbi:MAG: hypothetical protein J6X70_01055 [Muribaculaceae bacterium]|nr:hypothetical protein [Muribaculaceae bacterium]
MWFWIIVIAVIIGAAIAYFGGDGNKDDAIDGALAGGCLAGNCLLEVFIAGISIMVIIWLFSWLFG